MIRPGSPWPLAALLAVIVMSFIAGSAFVHWRLQDIDRSSAVIDDNALPSIATLAEARGEMKRLQIVLDEQLEDLSAKRPVASKDLDVSRSALTLAVRDYESLPVLPQEQELHAAVSHAHGDIERAITSFESALARGDADAARSVLEQDIRSAFDALFAATTRAIDVGVREARAQATEIRDVRANATYVAIALDIAATTITIVGAIVLRRIYVRQTELYDKLRQEEQLRAQELEHFAGRVAHDILGPLGTIGFALQFADADVEVSKRDKALGAGRRALERAKMLVAGLLDFARAGGKADVDARADLATTLADLATELAPTAAASSVELVVHPGRSHTLACNPGVLTSLVSNLARNAIKYMGDGPVRRVEIRAIDRGRHVRVEVEDTGPGLPPDVEQRIFEPYMRAANTTQPGIGLGLATVKRLAEAHGGSTGVRSEPGVGSTFWFELPKAESKEDASDAPRGRGVEDRLATGGAW